MTNEELFEKLKELIAPKESDSQRFKRLAVKPEIPFILDTLKEAVHNCQLGTIRQYIEEVSGKDLDNIIFEAGKLAIQTHNPNVILLLNELNKKTSPNFVAEMLKYGFPKDFIYPILNLTYQDHIGNIVSESINYYVTQSQPENFLNCFSFLIPHVKDGKIIHLEDFLTKLLEKYNKHSNNWFTHEDIDKMLNAFEKAKLLLNLKSI